MSTLPSALYVHVLQNTHCVARYVPGEPPAKLTRRSNAEFKWVIQAFSRAATTVLPIRCDHAESRGIPWPQHWLTACKILPIVDDKCKAACTDAQNSSKNASVVCRLLGAPKNSGALDILCGSGSGSVVSLTSSSGARQDYLLCAHVSGEKWLCHPGSFSKGILCADNPFRHEDLVARDILADKYDESKRPRRRITRKNTKVDLLDTASSFTSAWSLARAFALWQYAEGKYVGVYTLEEAKMSFTLPLA